MCQMSAGGWRGGVSPPDLTNDDFKEVKYRRRAKESCGTSKLSKHPAELPMGTPGETKLLRRPDPGNSASSTEPCTVREPCRNNPSTCCEETRLYGTGSNGFKLPGCSRNSSWRNRSSLLAPRVHVREPPFEQSAQAPPGHAHAHEDCSEVLRSGFFNQI